MTPPPATPWPRHESVLRPWRQKFRGGTREDRTLTEVAASIPPLIATAEFTAPAAVTLKAEVAMLAIGRASAVLGTRGATLSRLMIRTEAVASSKIERITATSDDLVRAAAGSKSNASATSMHAAAQALHQLVTATRSTGQIALDDLLRAHRELMLDDAQESMYAGQIRDMQNWIGGSDHSPRNALYVPPPPETVTELLHDLLTYAHRDDVPALTQAAIAHAQFESIHPFADGNGRIGRALVSACLMRRGLTHDAVLPLASGILARREEYFACLGTYRRGDPEPVVHLFVESAHAAALECEVTAHRIHGLPAAWKAGLNPSARTALAALLDNLAEQPIVTYDAVVNTTGVTRSQAYALIAQAESAEILREVTGRKRDRVWVATDVLAELDDLEARIRERMTKAPDQT
ncbi:Fic family protein [Micrococcales bacterium 31B]|nr:Fic family protein [Micrococcales bacterium 31B]